MKYIIHLVLLSSMIKGYDTTAQVNVSMVKDSLNAYLEKKHIPGAMVSIVTSDEVLMTNGFGYADIALEEKVTAEHLFRQGSISKSFTAIGMLKLLEEKGLSLDTPIKAIDPELDFENPWNESDPVTIEHLLEHTSGFDDFHLHAIYNNTDSVAPSVIKMVSSHQNSLVCRWRPGERKSYSNPNYILAGHLIEHLSGQGYKEFLVETIVLTIGMQSADFHFKKPVNGAMVSGYTYNGKDLNEVPFTSINGGPAGEFCASALDMATFLQFMLTRGCIDNTSLSLTKKEFDRIENSQTNVAAKNGLPYGYGLGNYSVWKEGHLFHGHGGGIDGFSSRYVYSRSADIGIAVAINREGNATAIVDEILRIIMDDLEVASNDRVLETLPLDMKSNFSGFYEFSSPRNELLAFTDKMLAGLTLDFLDDNRIVTRTLLGKAKDTLYYSGNNQFYKNDEGVPSCMLINSEENGAVFWINENYTVRASRLKRVTIFFGVVLSFILLGFFLIRALFRSILFFFGKSKKLSYGEYALMIGGICIVLMFVGFGIAMADKISSGGSGFGSWALYLFSIGLVVSVLFSLLSGVNQMRRGKLKISYTLNALSVLVVCSYLWDIGFIALKLWSY